jgi:uncharacterized SAM-binding protein YcdF (DUF218 family)
MSRRRALALAAALALLLAFAFLLTDAPARWLSVPDDPGPFDAVLVLAGDPNYERTITGSRIVMQDQARVLVLTGGQPGPGDSATSLRDEALRQGVPADRIRMETVSHSTRESLVAAEPLLRAEKARTVVIVTSPYHQRRALLAARRAFPGLVVRSRCAAHALWVPHRWWRNAWMRRIVLREYAKLGYYASRGWL